MKTKNLNFNRRSTHCVLSFIFQRCNYEKKNVIKVEQTYIAQETLYSRQTVSTELKYLQEQGYLTYNRALFNNLTTTEITLTDKSISILNAEAAKPQNKPIKTEASQPQADVPKTENKPSNKTIKTEADQPQAEAEKTPKQAKTEQADGNNKVKCGCVEEVLELLNYQAQRFADGKQNEFEFRRVARYIVSNNMTISQNIRYVEENNKFVNFA